MVNPISIIAGMIRNNDPVRARSERLPIDNHLVKGVIRDRENLLLIHDIDSCLTNNEDETLSIALHELSSHVTEEK